MNQNIHTATDTTGEYFKIVETRGRKSKAKALANFQM